MMQNPDRSKFGSTGQLEFHDGQSEIEPELESESRVLDKLQSDRGSEKKEQPLSKQLSPKNETKSPKLQQQQKASLQKEILQNKDLQGKLDQFDDQINPPNKLSTFIYEQPMICLFIWAVIIAILVALFFDYDLLKSQLPQYRHYAIENQEETINWDIKRVAESVPRTSMPPNTTAINNLESVERQYIISRWSTVILIDCSDCEYDMLSPQGIKLLYNLQTQLLANLVSISKFCLRTTYSNSDCDYTSTRFVQSPLAIFSSAITLSGGINNLQQATIDATMQAVISGSVASLPWRLAKSFFGREVTLESPRTKYMRLILNFAGPIAGYSSPDDRKDEQEDEFQEFTEEIQQVLDNLDKTPQGNAQIFQYSSAYGDKEYSRALNTDLLYLIGLFFLSFFLLLIKKNYSILISINALIVIVVATIGGMVFTQLVFGVEYYLKLYLLLFFFIFGCGINNSMILWDVYIKHQSDTGSDLQKFSSIFKEASLKILFCNSLGLFSVIVFDVCKLIPIKVMAYQSFISFILLTIFMVLFQFWAIVYQHKIISGIICKRWNCYPAPPSEITTKFVEKFTSFLTILRYPLVLLILGFIGVSLAYSFNYEYLEKVEVAFRDPHFLYNVNDLLYQKFNPPLYTTISIMFGVNSISKTSGKFDFNDLGSIEYDSTFDITDSSTQTALLNFCNNIQTSEDFNYDSQLVCWIQNFRLFVLANSVPFPVTNPTLFNTLLTTFLSSYTFGRLFLTNGYIIYVNQKVVYTKVEVKVNVQLMDDYEYVRQVKDSFIDYLTTKSESFTDGMKSYKQTASADWAWANSREELREYFFKVFPIVIGMSLLIFGLIFRNFQLTIIVLLGCLGIRVSFVAITNWAGWQSGTYEQIPFITAFAICSQFTVLVGYSYYQSSKTTRRLKIEDSLNQHLTGMIATTVIVVCSSLFLVGSQFFVIYNTVFAITIGTALSLFYGIFFVTSALLIIGPLKKVPDTNDSMEKVK